MELLDDYESDEEYVIILAPNLDKRSIKCFETIIARLNISSIIEVDYHNCSFNDETRNKYKDIITTVEFDNTIEFITALKELKHSLFNKKIIVDITGFKIPEMFSLFKFLKSIGNNDEIKVVYSMPYDYIFTNKPFTSYQSFDGNLDLCEPIGFSGNSRDDDNKSLFIFIGFEGSLSLKVIEEYQYEKLFLINNLPSFYSKYKDISVLNNYDVINENEKMYYASADNPFETFNLLDNMIKETDSVCIAPLSTKPVALGVCLYALNNCNVRIVYPISNSYKQHSSIDTYKSYIYTIPLVNLKDED